MTRVRRNPNGTLRSEWEWEPAAWEESPDYLRTRLRFAEVDGRVVLVNVEIGADFTNPEEPDPRPLTTTDMRRIPLARLTEEALRSYGRLATALEGVRREEALRIHRAIGGPSRGRRPLYGPDHFERVARIYAAAYAAGVGAPTRTVAEELQVSRSTANKWVARARSLGFLGETEKRKAGGVKEEK